MNLFISFQKYFKKTRLQHDIPPDTTGELFNMENTQINEQEKQSISPKNNDGKAYELFVQEIQQALFDAEPYAQQKNIIVEHNKILIDRCNCKRQFDIYWEYEMGGYKYKNVIECKDFEKGVPIEKIDALIGKMHDLPGIRAIIATRVKFQEGAKKKAEENNIDIIIVRNEDEQKDWTLPDGTPMIKQVDIELNIFLPIRITAFRPIFDMKWAREHNIEEFEINAPDSEILLINKETGVSETLYDYINTIPRNTTNEEHQSTYREDFNELYLCSNGRQIKVNALEFDYIAPSAEKRRIKIAPEVKGVIEYLNEKRKVIVLKNQDDRIKTVTIKPL